jgi:hypothetical protein
MSIADISTPFPISGQIYNLWKTVYYQNELAANYQRDDVLDVIICGNKRHWGFSLHRLKSLKDPLVVFVNKTRRTIVRVSLTP